MQTAELLAKYTNLQSVDLRHNMLTDLSHLSRLPRLTHLDASYNNLTEVGATGIVLRPS